jgi:hypothetical protein
MLSTGFVLRCIEFKVKQCMRCRLTFSSLSLSSTQSCDNRKRASATAVAITATKSKENKEKRAEEQSDVEYFLCIVPFRFFFNQILRRSFSSHSSAYNTVSILNVTCIYT